MGTDLVCEAFHSCLHRVGNDVCQEVALAAELAEEPVNVRSCDGGLDLSGLKGPDEGVDEGRAGGGGRF